MQIIRNAKLFNICRSVLITASIVVWSMKKLVVFNFIEECDYVLYVFAGLSLILLAWDILANRSILKGRYALWLIGFTAVCLISSIVNIKYGYIRNAYIIIFITSQMFLFYSSISTGSIDEVKNEIRLFGNVFIGIVTLFMSSTFVMYLFNIQIIATNRIHGRAVSQGCNPSGGRAWGMFITPGTMIIAVIAIVFCAYFIYTYKNIFLRIMYSVFIAINFIAVFLSGARAATYPLYIVAVLLPLLVMKRSGDKICGKVLLRKAAASVLMLAAAFGLTQGLEILLPYVQSAVYSSAQDTVYPGLISSLQRVYDYNDYDIEFANVSEHIDEATGEAVFVFDASDTSRFERVLSNDFTTGRIPFWSSGIKIFLSAPIFGASPKNCIVYAQEHFPDCYVAKYGMEIHSDYLDILAKTGVLGLLTMGGFMVLIAIYMIKYLLRRHHHVCQVGFFVSALSAMLVYMLVECDVFLHNMIQAKLFWLILGFIVAFIECDRREEMEVDKIAES